MAGIAATSLPKIFRGFRADYADILATLLTMRPLEASKNRSPELISIFWETYRHATKKGSLNFAKTRQFI